MGSPPLPKNFQQAATDPSTSQDPSTRAHWLRRVVLVVNAPGRCFDVLVGKALVTSLTMQGLEGQSVPFESSAAQLLKAAHSDYCRWLLQ